LSGTLNHSEADAVLCLDARLPIPDPAVLDRLLDGPADAWHAGLRLGLAEHPRMMDHVDPIWMLNASAAPDIESTSWRVSLRALLVRTAVLGQLGGPAHCFDTLSGSGLDVGLRWTNAGALVRHAPDLAPAATLTDEEPTELDGIRLINRHYGQRWALWGLQRSVITRAIGPRAAAPMVRPAVRTPPPATPHYETPVRPVGRTDRTVTVIVPTLDRYAFLEPLLHQLAAQTFPPHEVIVADQTSVSRRRSDLREIEPGLPVTVIALPEPGQSTARNAALRASSGELVLLLDDDLTIEGDLIANHLRRVIDGVDASCGGIDDATAGPPPVGFRHRRASDVFPAGNTMLRRSALHASGLFDLVYDQGSRADHDLGMRLYEQGALLVYDPTPLVFHHHAPSGGLRAHGARTITRAGSRRSLAVRALPSATELYLGLRYFTPHQNHESGPIRLLSLVFGEGPLRRRVARAIVQVALLPSSARRIAERRSEAREFLASRPDIPKLEDEPEVPPADRHVPR
jgi:GT2 family glycosyltransferase